MDDAVLSTASSQQVYSEMTIEPEIGRETDPCGRIGDWALRSNRCVAGVK
jgi:hypothetical protein